MRAVFALSALLLGGCAGTAVPPSSLVPPAARCMAKPAAIPQPNVGEDALDYNGRLIDHIKGETSKEACLQKYARTITN